MKKTISAFQFFNPSLAKHVMHFLVNMFAIKYVNFYQKTRIK